MRPPKAKKDVRAGKLHRLDPAAPFAHGSRDERRMERAQWCL
jgi:hypothetical protein